MWRRRAAIVSQVRRKEQTDLALLYDCIEPNRCERYCETHELSPLSRREALRSIARIRGAS